MIVRRLAEPDAEQFQTLRLRGLAEEETAFASSFQEECDRPLDSIRVQLAPKADGAIFGAFEGEVLIAMVAVERESMKKLSHKGFIWGMYVAPEWRSKGRGAQILQSALQHAWTELKVLQVNLGVHTLNAAALKVYKAAGFEVFGTERGALWVNGQPQDEHHMVCRAPSAA